MATVTTSSSGVPSSTISSSVSAPHSASAEISRLRQLTDKLQVEAAELRARLQGERGAVRALRAAHGAEVRKERATERKRRAQLESQLSEARRTVSTSSTHASNGCEHCGRLNKVLKKQKEAVKDLEIKLHKVVEADKVKAADLRSLHEKHIAEIAKITRIHKQDAHKLLEELKTKDRLIGQLRRKTLTAVEIIQQGGKKGRDSDRKKIASVAPDLKQDDQNTTNEKNSSKQEPSRKRRRADRGDGGAGDVMSPQDVDDETRRSEEPESGASVEEETDSAVSSAPSSLSPQPCSPTGGDSTTVPFSAWHGRDEHVHDELERALFVKQAIKSGRLRKRLLSLEAREAELLRELSDLRDQNELLEFRVLELTNRLDDEDFSSVCERVACETRDMSTETADMPLDTGGEPVRSCLLKLARKVADPQDVRDLLHVAALLDALDSLSAQQSKDMFDDECEIKRVSTLPSQVSKPDRLVATVSPFRRRADEEGVNDEEEEEEEEYRSSNRRGECCGTNRGTQTDAETAVPGALTGVRPSPPSLDLATEVRKLDRLRESIEQRQQRQLEFYRGRVDVLERKLRVYESSGERQARQLAERLGREVRLAAQVEQLATAVRKLQADNSRLEEERCELEEAENDTRLRCQRLETELEALARSRMAAKRRARDSRNHASHWESLAGRYEQRNYELEERECELRHRLDVLERTAPALLLFGAWKRMQSDGSGGGAGLDPVAAAVNRLTTMSHKNSPPHGGGAVPKSGHRCACECTHADKEEQAPRSPDVAPSGSAASLDTRDLDMIKCVEQLKERELDMRRRILDLERREAAYMETLQQADDIWAQMEGGYKERLSVADRTESELRNRLRRLEERAPIDEERVNELEEAERELSSRVAQLERENMRLRTSADLTESEAAERAAQAERKAAERAGEAERERRRSRELEKELGDARITLGDAGRTHAAETSALREQLARARNELVHLEVTNGELREEVITLEYRVAELGREAAERAAADERAVRDLTDELLEQTSQMEEMRRAMSGAPPSAKPSTLTELQQEKPEPPSQQPKSGTQSEPCLRLEQAVCDLKSCDICSEIVEPDLVETAEGLTTLCKVVHTGSGLSTASSPPDIQVSGPARPPVTRATPSTPCTLDTCALLNRLPTSTVPVHLSAAQAPLLQIPSKLTQSFASRPLSVAPSAACSHQTCPVFNPPSVSITQAPRAFVSPSPSKPVSTTTSRPLSVAPSAPCTNDTCPVLNPRPFINAPPASLQQISSKPLSVASSKVCTKQTCTVLNSRPSITPAVSAASKPASTSPSRQIAVAPTTSCTKQTCPTYNKQLSTTASAATITHPLSTNVSASRALSEPASVCVVPTCSVPAVTATLAPDVAIKPRYPCPSYSDSSSLEHVTRNAIQANMSMRPAGATSARDFNVTATMTQSGTLEVETEGPPGVVEHTLAMTDSGNLDIFTQFTPDPAPASRQLKYRNTRGRLALPPPRLHRSILELLLDQEFSRSEMLRNCGRWCVPQIYMVSEHSVRPARNSSSSEQQSLESTACQCPRPVSPPPPPPPCAFNMPYSPYMMPYAPLPYAPFPYAPFPYAPLPYAPMPYCLPSPVPPCVAAAPSQPRPSRRRPSMYDKGAQTSELSRPLLVEPEDLASLRAALPAGALSLPIVTEPEEPVPTPSPRAESMSLLETAASTPTITPIIDDLVEAALATVSEDIEQEILIPPPESFDDELQQSMASFTYTRGSLSLPVTARSMSSGQYTIPLLEVTSVSSKVVGEEDFYTPAASSTHLLPVTSQPRSLAASSRRAASGTSYRTVSSKMSTSRPASRASELMEGGSGRWTVEMTSRASKASRASRTFASRTSDIAQNASGTWSVEMASAVPTVSDIAQHASGIWSPGVTSVPSQASRAGSSIRASAVSPGAVSVTSKISDVPKKASGIWSTGMAATPSRVSEAGRSTRRPSETIRSVGSRASGRREGGEMVSTGSRMSAARSTRVASAASAFSGSAGARPTGSRASSAPVGSAMISARSRPSRTSGVMSAGMSGSRGSFEPASRGSIIAGSALATPGGSVTSRSRAASLTSSEALHSFVVRGQVAPADADTFVDRLSTGRTQVHTPSRISACSAEYPESRTPSHMRPETGAQPCNCQVCKCNPCKDPSIGAPATKARPRGIPLVCRCPVCRCPNCPARAYAHHADSVLQTTLNEGFVSDELEVMLQQPTCESEPALSIQPFSAETHTPPDELPAELVSSIEQQVPPPPAEETYVVPACELPCVCEPCVCEPCDDPEKFVPLLTSTKRDRTESGDFTPSDQPTDTFNPPPEYGSSEPEEVTEEGGEEKLLAMMKEIEPCPAAPADTETTPGDEEGATPVDVTYDVEEPAPTESFVSDTEKPPPDYGSSEPEEESGEPGEEQLLAMIKEVPCPVEEAPAASPKPSAPQVQQVVSVDGRSVSISYPAPREDDTQLKIDKIDHPLKCECPRCKCEPCPDPRIKPLGTTDASSAFAPPVTSTKIKDATVTIEELPQPDKGRTDETGDAGAPAAESWEFQPPASSTKIKDVQTQRPTEAQLEQQLVLPDSPGRLSPTLLGPGITQPVSCTCPPEVRAAPKTSPLTDDKWRGLDTDTLERRLASLEAESGRMSSELTRVRSLMERMQNACDRQLRQVHERQPLVEPAPSRSFRATMDGLGSAHAYLEARCREKDRLIAAVTDELRVRAESGVFEQLLGTVANRAPPPIDYDRAGVSNALPRPPVQRTPAEKPGDSRWCSCRPTSTDPSPMTVTELRRVEPDALLVKWVPPAAAHCFAGYEVEVDGMLRTRVRSVDRTAAVLHGLEPQPNVQHVVTVHAILKSGDRVAPPASAVYEPRPSSSSPQRQQ